MKLRKMNYFLVKSESSRSEGAVGSEVEVVPESSKTNPNHWKKITMREALMRTKTKCLKQAYPLRSRITYHVPNSRMKEAKKAVKKTCMMKVKICSTAVFQL